MTPILARVPSALLFSTVRRRMGGVTLGKSRAMGALALRELRVAVFGIVSPSSS